MAFGLLGSDAMFHGSTFVDPAAFGTWDPTGASDSTSALQAALSAGGTILVSPGTYKLNTVLMGNGASGTASIIKPTRLIGLGSGQFPQYGNPGPDVTFKFNGSSGGTMMQVAGPLQYWGIEGIAFDGNGLAGTILQVISSQFGYTRDLSFKGWTGIAYEETCWATRPGGWGNINSMHNRHVGHIYDMPSVANAIGQLLTGNSGVNDNTCYDEFDNMIFQNPAAAGVAINDLYLQFCDSNQFKNYHFVGGDIHVNIMVFDYSSISNRFPTNNFFFGIDPSGSLSPPNRAVNIGSPIAGLKPNMILGLDEANGATLANMSVPGLAVLTGSGMVLPSLIGVATPTNANAATAGVALNSIYRDTADPCKLYIRTV